MNERAEQIETLRDRLEALRAGIHQVPPEQLGENVLVDFRGELGAIQRQLIPLASQASRLEPERQPLEHAVEKTDELFKWLHPQAETRDVDRLDQIAGSATKALTEAAPLARTTDTLHEVQRRGFDASFALMAGDPAKAHGIVRQMIDLLQGTSREVRGLVQQERTPER
jgi:hypothetical protein